MRNCVAILGSLLAASIASAAESPPAYDNDPFRDGDFRQVPLILESSHVTKGRGEFAVLFVSSAVDKYTSHLGGLLEFNYHLTDTLGAAFALGAMHGQLTSIVTTSEGIIGNKVTETVQGKAECAGGCDVTPAVPDYRQITGVVDLLGVWSPLYGKINVVSEGDANLQLYGLAGLGVNGTRVVKASATSSAADALDYKLDGSGFGQGGLFSDLKVHGTIGVGLRIYVLDWLSLRTEYRALMFQDKFDFKGAPEEEESYLSVYHFLHAGLGFSIL